MVAGIRWCLFCCIDCCIDCVHIYSEFIVNTLLASVLLMGTGMGIVTVSATSYPSAVLKLILALMLWIFMLVSYALVMCMARSSRVDAELSGTLHGPSSVSVLRITFASAFSATLCLALRIPAFSAIL